MKKFVNIYAGCKKVSALLNTRTNSFFFFFLIKNKRPKKINQIQTKNTKQTGSNCEKKVAEKEKEKRKGIQIQNKNTHLTPSRAGSENKQSRVGRPGKLALSTEPSGSTNFFRSSKLCFPGASLIRMGM